MVKNCFLLVIMLRQIEAQIFPVVAVFDVVIEHLLRQMAYFFIANTFEAYSLFPLIILSTLVIEKPITYCISVDAAATYTAQN